MLLKIRKGHFAAAVVGLAFLAQPLAVQAEEVLSRGTFSGKSGHVTSGGVAVVKASGGSAVVLQPNFNFDGAPDPKVGFGRDGRYDPASKLSHLERNAGKQVYKIPASIDPSQYNEVYIWCEKYSVPLGVATLE